MTSALYGLNLALQALQTHQRALEVIAHNIANVQTPGYSRQAPVLASQAPAAASAQIQDPLAAQVGLGVSMEEVRRYTSEFLTRQVRREKASSGQWESIHTALQEMEGIFNEPSETAINGALSAFWASWQEVANNPQGTSVRAALREAASYLTSLFRSTYRKLSNLRWDLDSQVGEKVNEINNLAKEISRLNGQIQNAQVVGGTGNDLQDRRDLALDRLAQLADIAYTKDDQGKVTVTIGGRALVHAAGVVALTTARNPLNDQMSVAKWSDSGAEVNFSGGEIKGIQQARDEVLPVRLDALDNLAADLISAVNAQHELGYTLDGETGVSFFFSGTGASDMSLSTAIEQDLDKVAASTAPNSPGDGSNALAIAQLEQELLAQNGEATLGDFYRSFISQLGLDAKEARTMRENANILLGDLQSRKSAETGVSLDEEAIDLIRYQRAYQAAARVITTLDEMLDVVVNRLGIVGR